MKRVSSAIAVLLVVSGLFAFAPKADNYCYYKLQSGACRFVNFSETNTAIQGGDEDVIDIPPTGCPSTLTGAGVCTKIVDEVID